MYFVYRDTLLKTESNFLHFITALYISNIGDRNDNRYTTLKLKTQTLDLIHAYG